MDLNLLVALDALLTERSVTGAASRLCVTQPAMSVALSKLRSQFSDQLLERIGRQMVLTPFGEQLSTQVRDVLHDVRVLLHRRSEFIPSTDRRDFHLVMSSSVAEIFGVPALRRLREIAPNVRCQIDIFVGPDLLRRVLDGKMDLCIQLLEAGNWDPIPDMDALDSAPLFCDDYVIIADAENDSIHETLDYESFCAMDHVETRFVGDLRSPVERTLAAMSSRPPTAMLVSTYALAIEAVLGTPMTAIVPRKVAQMSPRRDFLSIVESPVSLVPLDHKLIWHRRNENDPGHLWLRNFLLNFCGSPDFAGRA
ncbi:LysR family transcriptional regulator [Sphingomonas daechungensis]|uniref:LysR family transcriptional regulator n=1 Tax=Sphingomonas daechungensis TaxID=1176646 RepID=UPI00378350F0